MLTLSYITFSFNKLIKFLGTEDAALSWGHSLKFSHDSAIVSLLEFDELCQYMLLFEALHQSPVSRCSLDVKDYHQKNVSAEFKRVFASIVHKSVPSYLLKSPVC